jgi:hypothetical protein
MKITMREIKKLVKEELSRGMMQEAESGVVYLVYDESDDYSPSLMGVFTDKQGAFALADQHAGQGYGGAVVRKASLNAPLGVDARDGSDIVYAPEPTR